MESIGTVETLTEEHKMEYQPDDMRDSMRELQNQMEALRIQMRDPIRELLEQMETFRRLASPVRPAEELLKQLDIRGLIEQSDPMKQIRDMTDSLHPPQPPDEFGDKSEEDSEEEW
jgi:hypothetical protein